MKGYLLLANGQLYEGTLMGAAKPVMAELVFTTAMTGYLETLTDPSYEGEIVIQTFPTIGNYGVIPEDFESPRPRLSAYIVRELCDEPSNFRCQGKLDDYLKAQGIPCLTGVDTRALTRVIRNAGVMNAALLTGKPENPEEICAQLKVLPFHPSIQDVTCDGVQPAKKRGIHNVVLWDFGAKANIQRELEKRGCKIPFDVASNPEFLKEGAAIKDFMSPDRVVVGVESERARKLMTKLYRPFLINNFRVLFMDIPSAEMTKYAANAMLATRISFMNEIANLCDLVGADVEMVRKGIGSDARIGSKFLYPGCGYGGSCFPKDVKALAHTAHEHGYTMQVIEAVERVNERQKSIVFDKLQLALSDLRGKTVAVWGLAFKPETDDMREAPALVVIDRLLEAGATVRAYDPVAANESRRRLGEERVYHAASMYEAAEGADAVALITEWKQFRMPDWTLLRSAMRDNIIVDGRNILDKEEALNAGFRYYGIGK